MNIFEALRESHDKQRTLVKSLAKTHGDSEGREELFTRLKDELERHAMAEERHFYMRLMEADVTQEKARHSVAEHKELDDFIKSLEAQDRSSAGWISTAQELEQRLIHHLDEEEQEVFQMAGKVLSDEQKSTSAEEYLAHMNSQD